MVLNSAAAIGLAFTFGVKRGLRECRNRNHLPTYVQSTMKANLSCFYLC